MDIDALMDELAMSLSVDKDQIEMTSELKSYKNWDSLARVMLFAFAEDHYGVNFTSEELDKVVIVEDIISLIRSKLPVAVQ